MNTAKKPGTLRRLLSGSLRALDLSRRIIVNLVFVLVMLLIIGAIFGGGPDIKPRSVLVIAPRGEIVEEFSGDPMERALGKLMGEDIVEVRLRDLVRVLDAAAQDDRIERVLLRPDDIWGAGVASLDELRHAIARYKASGKELIAYADGMTQGQFYLAAHADQVFMHPEGGVLLEGLGRYRRYYRELLEDKLGIDVHLFRVGEYKSAGEPYIRDAASPEALEADAFWLGDLWQRFVADVALARDQKPEDLNLSLDQVRARLEQSDGDLAAMALDSGMVDELRTFDEIRQMLIDKGVADEENKTFRQVSLDEYLAVLDAEQDTSKPAQIAIVVAAGEILGGDQPPGTVGGVSTAKRIREAREDEHVKALVLRVDSPGGGVFPSEQIRREVELTRAAGKPVVVSMGDLAASGGYWISMNADEIIANPNTITGSIGIYGLFMNIPETLGKIGIRTDGVGTTELAGAFDPTRALDPRVGELIQDVIDRGYRQFIGKVASARGRSEDEIDGVARGRVWSGAQAKERGLVDRLGTLEDAIAAAAKRAGIEGKPVTRYIERELSGSERFVIDLVSQARLGGMVEFLGLKSPLTRLVMKDPELQQQLRLIGELQGKPFGSFAYCFCSTR